MDFGLAYFPTHDGMSPGAVARLVEDHGFESLWFAEHTHIPASEATRDGTTPLPRKYAHTYDLFVALTAAASATTRLRVGSAICLIIERDPIVTAKAVASVDHLSGGRLELGVGAGWNRTEMRNHGTDPRKRMAVMRERVEAMKEIWTQDEASYDGEYVSFERIRSYPKPAQRPHPPVLVGGDGPTVEERVLAFGDAWFPNYNGRREILERYQALCERADRPIELSLTTVPADPAELEAIAEVGARRVMTWIPSGPRSSVERSLQTWESAIADFLGE
jgi:probable F420-dependent oxidoreductase